MKELFTVNRFSEGLYKEKGSKFNSLLYGISGENDVKGLLAKVREEHTKARHICYAWRCGGKGDKERCFDAGEPNGSAGLPILNQLHSARLTNVLLIVVRYYGGTKLGLGPLVRAYKEAARDAISKSEIIPYEDRIVLTLEFPQVDLGKVERLIRIEKWPVEAKAFGLNCSFRISVLNANLEDVEIKLGKLPSLKIISKNGA